MTLTTIAVVVFSVGETATVENVNDNIDDNSIGNWKCFKTVFYKIYYCNNYNSMIKMKIRIM